MSDTDISAADHFERKRIAVLDSEMAYIDEGSGDAIVFLHGNPTSSYLWRNIIPHLQPYGRCLAPDLVGMGASGQIPPDENGNPSMYRFVDHYRYLQAWMDAMDLGDNVLLVIHDWGSALGFNWAFHHQDRVKGIVYMEAIVTPVGWDDWPDAARGIFQGMRSPKGDELILERNFFVERILPSSVIRKMSDEEMNVYRAPFTEAGERRRPTLTWPREIPFEGEPADVYAIVNAYSAWMASDDSPAKLFINADPGIILIGRQREICRSWPNQAEVTVKGLHFVQEDSPHEIGTAAAEFVATLFG